ncbi:hypothetical protein TRFO_42176 [Tritrichomonas foetus]|uniref:Nucleoplasmin-like domain-containing protein n=1 Tax=Tritrichomonas foetus TaxID=1144522 RepID=A0A1J4KXJ1_9EUKA|nr:hypothetical protein TRFO_42176 [Tritrichomonas foetus]|eukprot:OHT15971.1 hypothetical protein TRFO_42176 [Tritrichomonas foetus]
MSSEESHISPEEEEEIAKLSLSMDIEAGTPKRLDFSKFGELENEMHALLIFANRNDTGDKGTLTLTITYKDVESYEGNVDEQPIVTKTDKIEFAEGDYDQKDIAYTFTNEHEATFSVEGAGSVNITGMFHQGGDDEEEEEEEEAIEENPNQEEEE